MATAKRTTSKKTTSKKAPAKKSAAKRNTNKRAAIRAAATKKAASTKIRAGAKKPATKKVTQKGPLYWLLVGGAALLVILAAAVFLLGDTLRVAVVSQHLAENQLVADRQLLPAITELFQLNLTYLITAILLAGTVWRILLLTKLSSRYETQISGRFTSLSWVELSVLGPLLLTVIGLVVGARSVTTLLLLAAVPLGISVLGYLSDRYNMLQHQTWLKHLIISGTLALPWVVVAIYVLHTYLYASVAFTVGTYAALVVAFLAFVMLAVVHKKQILGEGRFIDFVYAEKWIVGLHLVLLATLAAFPFV